MLQRFMQQGQAGVGAAAQGQAGQQQAGGANGAQELFQSVISNLVDNLQNNQEVRQTGQTRLRLVPTPGGGFTLLPFEGAAAPAAAATEPVPAVPVVDPAGPTSPAAPDPMVSEPAAGPTSPAADPTSPAVAEVASMDVDAGEDGGDDAGAPRGGVGLGAQLPPRRSSARKRRAPHQHPQNDLD